MYLIPELFVCMKILRKLKKRSRKRGSLENAIVVKENEVLNKDGLRNSKEFVNHKILDCIGDLYTCGYRMLASLECSQGGHYLTNQLLKKYLKIKIISQ